MKMMKMKKFKVPKFKTAKVDVKATGAPSTAKSDSYGKAAKRRMNAFSKRVRKG